MSHHSSARILVSPCLDDEEASQLSFLARQGVPGEPLTPPPILPDGTVSQSSFVHPKFRHLSVTLTDTSLEAPPDMCMSMLGTAAIE